MTISMKLILPIFIISCIVSENAEAWIASHYKANTAPSRGVSHSNTIHYSSSPDAWSGEVVSNTEGGKIKGCRIEAVGEQPILEWVVTIDGVEADLGRFSEAIYKKITSDAKKERFQGFRPGTIPPHLEPTYRAFSMDECARETVLEALEQNDIRPFESARSEMVFENLLIPPPVKKGKKKKSKGRKKPQSAESAAVAEDVPEEEPQWLSFPDMKGAIDAGWKPGQSYSFVAKKVKGQKVKGTDDISGARPVGGFGLNY